MTENKENIKEIKTEADLELIRLVHSSPELYDKTEPNYKNVIRKTAIWDNISTQVHLAGYRYILKPAY
jgi:hypothetical protein